MSKARKEYAYQINLIPEKEGGYTVLVPLGRPAWPSEARRWDVSGRLLLSSLQHGHGRDGGGPGGAT